MDHNPNRKYYRPDIDGLRALAIFAVVLFHAGVLGFSGGFVGVDIFFVISGFLITSILLRELEQGSFSLLSFWERRMRRIVPALAVVLGACAAAAYVVLLYPPDLVDFGESLVAQGLFLSNVFFMRRDTYFAEPAERSPLLHTWTLSIEEQFYIILPILLFLVWRIGGRRVSTVFVCVGLVSLLSSIYLVSIVPAEAFALPLLPNMWGDTVNQTAGFYLLPTRAWEFIVGALVATLGLSIVSSKAAEAVSLLGVAAIVYAVTQFDAATAFPGVSALLPAVGSGAIIVANTRVSTIVGKVLSWRGVVGVGLISYSLYLWHWPLLVLADVVFGDGGAVLTTTLILVSVGLAWVTYRYVEAPFRSRQYLPGTAGMLGAGLVTLLMFVGIGYFLTFADTQARLPGYARELFDAREDLGPRYNECFDEKTLADYEASGPCIIGSPGATDAISFVVWGDSHSGSLLDAIDLSAQAGQVRGAYFGGSACVPIADATLPNTRAGCRRLNDLARQYIDAHDIDHVLLIARWHFYLTPSSDRCIGCSTDGLSSEAAEQVYRREFEERLTAMLGDLRAAGRSVYLLMPVPVHETFDLRQFVYASIRAGMRQRPDLLSLEEHYRRTGFTRSVFHALAGAGLLRLMDPADTLCSDGAGCAFEVNGTQIYLDPSHLNFTGARMLQPLFADFIRQIQSGG